MYLMQQGFDNVANVDGGMIAWKNAGLPVRSGPSRRARASCRRRSAERPWRGRTIVIDARPAGPRHRLLLAGSFGPERIPARPDPAQPAWHEPLHVRDARSARDRLSSQVAVGADVIVAPTWLTHRRALLPIGETRRARAWTAAAVRVAREAVEVGLERRALRIGRRGSDAAGSAPLGRRRESADPPGPPPRLTVRPARSPWSRPAFRRSMTIPIRARADSCRERLPASATTATRPDSWRTLSPTCSSWRGRRRSPSLRLAIDAVAGTGLPTWVALSRAGNGGDRRRGVARSGARVERGADAPARDSRRWDDRDSSQPGAGSSRIRPPRGRTPSAAGWRRVRLPSVSSMGRRRIAWPPSAPPSTPTSAPSWGLRRRPRRAGGEHVQQAAAMAPGGAALWLSASGTRESLEPRLPAGFEWLIVDPSEAGVLPAAHFRLVVDPGERPVAPSLRAALLDEGGVLVVAEGASGLPTDDAAAARPG